MTMMKKMMMMAMMTTTTTITKTEALFSFEAFSDHGRIVTPLSRATANAPALLQCSLSCMPEVFFRSMIWSLLQCSRKACTHNMHLHACVKCTHACVKCMHDTYMVEALPQHCSEKKLERQASLYAYLRAYMCMHNTCRYAYEYEYEYEYLHMYTTLYYGFKLNALGSSCFAT